MVGMTKPAPVFFMVETNIANAWYFQSEYPSAAALYAARKKAGLKPCPMPLISCTTENGVVTESTYYASDGIAYQLKRSFPACYFSVRRLDVSIGTPAYAVNESQFKLTPYTWEWTHYAEAHPADTFYTEATGSMVASVIWPILLDCWHEFGTKPAEDASTASWLV